MTIPEGTFALKIKDPKAFYTAMKSNYEKIESKIEEEYNKKGTSNLQGLTKSLLKIINDNNLGIGIYQANNNFSEWDELTLPKLDPNDDKPVEKKPCSLL